MRFKRRRSVAGLLLVVLAVFGTVPAHAQKRGGTLIIGSEAEFNGFNHLKARIFNQNTVTPASAVMEGLFAYEGAEIKPRLGVSFEEAPDRLSAVVRLRRGVKFHDGTPFNADAVVFHYRRLMDPKSGVNTSMIAPIKTVEKVDDFAVRFVLAHPWPALQSALALEHLINLIGSPTALASDPEGFHRKPIGTGPFRVVEWRAGDRLVLERNPDYWEKGLPYLDGVVFRILPDGNTRYQSIKSGEVHIASIDNAGHILDAQKDPGLVVHRHQGSGALTWNFNHAREPFNDVRVRAAVIHAVDAKAIAENFYLGTTTVATGLLGPNSGWFCPNIRWRSYDPEKAKALLAEVGKPVKFTLTAVNNPQSRRMASILQQFMQAVGMEVDIRLVEQSQNVRIGVTGDYQMDVWRFTDFGGDPDLVLTYYFGTRTGKPVTRHDASRIDPLLDAARVEPDRERRHDLYCRVAELVSEEAILLFPNWTTYHAVAQPFVRNVPPLVNNIIRPRAIWLDR
ncbi:MAG TPA: ABC transporter substrate-binding protein [Burkholderiales bacterium]